MFLKKKKLLSLCENYVKITTTNKEVYCGTLHYVKNHHRKYFYVVDKLNNSSATITVYLPLCIISKVEKINAN